MRVDVLDEVVLEVVLPDVEWFADRILASEEGDLTEAEALADAHRLRRMVLEEVVRMLEAEQGGDESDEEDQDERR